MHDRLVSSYMTRDPVSVTENTPLADVAALLDRAGVSALPVVADDGRAVGVISRRDLMRVGELIRDGTDEDVHWRLPDRAARDIMSRQVIAVSPAASIPEAAARMVEAHVHRVLVHEDGELRGVLTTHDVMLAIIDAQIAAPVSDFATHHIRTIRTFEPVGAARLQLEALQIRALVVTYEGSPVGVFTEEDALGSRHHPAETRVERVMGRGLIVLRPDVPTWRAAERMTKERVWRVVLKKGSELVGILTSFDLTRAAEATRTVDGEPPART